MNDRESPPVNAWTRELHALLARPDTATPEERPGTSRRHVTIGVSSLAAYGAVAGLFQGGAQVLETAWKAPLIVGFSLLLCLPSLFVFSSLAGVTWQGQRLTRVATRTFALSGLVLVGLLPVAWLFSVSSRYLGFVTLLHAGCWLLAIALAGRSLARALREEGGSGAALWAALVFVVALQVATNLRPVLWRQPEDGWWQTEKRFFLEHFGDSLERRQAEPARVSR